MASIILPHTSLPRHPVFFSPRPRLHSLTNIHIKSCSQKIFVSCCPSSLRDLVPITAQDSSPSYEETVVPEPDAADRIEDSPDFRGCKTCGGKEIEKGCNGEGRIQGGIATIRGFGWWPIKAFRPCPKFVASGGRYKRYGQSLDEVAFGKDERNSSVKLNAKST